MKSHRKKLHVSVISINVSNISKNKKNIEIQNTIRWKASFEIEKKKHECTK